MAAHGLALLAEQQGQPARAFELLTEARRRTTRLPDTYVWVEAHILDTQCTLGLQYDHPATGQWLDALQQLASRTGMRELTVRALLHEAALAGEESGASARLLTVEIDNPRLADLVTGPAALPVQRGTPSLDFTHLNGPMASSPR